jgi:branched-chain amino acid transport system ATP-binding protein
VSPVLELQGIHAGYGAFRALFGIDLAIGAGEAVALVGPNGAGKTTVARVASGLVPVTAGRVTVDGTDLTSSPTYHFARAGVAHAPEGRSTFCTLTVEENLELSIRRVRGRKGLRQGLEQAYELFPGLADRRHQVGDTLSGGQQRMLALARVLVDAPKVLVADELSLGLAPMIVGQTYEMLARVRETGTALLVIEQHVSHALALCDRVVLLQHGRTEWSGPASEAGDRVRSHLGVVAT